MSVILAREHLSLLIVNGRLATVNLRLKIEGRGSVTGSVRGPVL